MAKEIVGKPIATAFLKYAERMEQRSQSGAVGQPRPSAAPSTAADPFKHKPASQAFIKMLEKTGKLKDKAKPLMEARTEPRPAAVEPSQRTGKISAEDLLKEAMSSNPQQAVDMLIKRLGGK